MKNAMIAASALAVAVALSACSTSRTSSQTATTPAMEKCYGIAQAGKNDCAGAAHACAGQSSVSRSSEDFVMIPAGTCDKIVGGTAKA